MFEPTPLLERALTSRLLDCFPERTPGLRRLGREAEYPVVCPDGSAADIQGLLRRLVENHGLNAKREGDLLVGALGRTDILLEVGHGTIELVSPPADDLFELRREHERAMAELVRATTAEGLLILGLGIQPVTPPCPELMSPKQRYAVMLESMGPAWLGFTNTASDQLHVDVGREELVGLVNLVNLLSPVTVALCANSPWDGAVCGREFALAQVSATADRMGMIDAPIGDVQDWVERIASLPYLMVQDGDVTRAHSGSFAEWVSENLDPESDQTWAAFQHHERYVWNHGRPRGLLGTIEIRAACQQPWPEHDSACALALGMVCAGESLAALVRDALGPDPWPRMRAWLEDASRRGLLAPEPARGLTEAVLDRCAAGLESRGRGEEELLGPLYRRLEVRRSPGFEAMDAMARGVDALVAHAEVRC